MRILVTGASGFTGGHLARALAAGGWSVRALVRSAAQADELARCGIEPCQGDLRDPAAIEVAVEGASIVYHIAAVYRQAGLPRATYRAINAKAPQTLVEAAARAGVRRFVHCSTVGVHGDIDHPPANEEAPIKIGRASCRERV